MPYSTLADEDGADRAQRIGEDAEKGHHDHRRRHARQNQLLGRIAAERPDRVDLLGHVHGADLGGHPAPDPPPHDDGRQRRPELAAERQDDDAGDVVDSPEALKAVRKLDGHDHPDEDRRDRDDSERAHAQRVDLIDRRRDLEGPAERRLERTAREHPDRAKLLDETDGLPLPRLSERRRRWRRTPGDRGGRQRRRRLRNHGFPRPDRGALSAEVDDECVCVPATKRPKSAAPSTKWSGGATKTRS